MSHDIILELIPRSGRPGLHGVVTEGRRQDLVLLIVVYLGHLKNVRNLSL